MTTLYDVVGYINAGVPFMFTPDSVEDYTPIADMKTEVTINLGAISREVMDLFYGGGVNHPLGSMDEAQLLFKHASGYSDVSRENRAPEGWTFLGSGGTRACYLSPSGVAYKVCHRYNDTDAIPNSNDIEYDNFLYIRAGGKLLENWRVPHSYLYKFKGRQWVWSYADNGNIEKDVFVSVIAVEKVNGRTYQDLHRSRKDRADNSLDIAINEAFTAVGLEDAFMGNAMKCELGINWIVDAAETYLDDRKKEVYR